MKEKTVAIASDEQRQPRRTYAYEAGTSDPLRHATSPRVSRASLSIEYEDFQIHLYCMTQFCFIQDMYAHMGALGRYLTHQSDTWAIAQRFRDCFSRETPTPYYGHYRYHGMETPIQLGGPVSQQPHRSPFRPSHQQYQTPQRKSGLMSPISAFVHGDHGLDPASFIDFDANMQERDANDII